MSLLLTLERGPRKQSVQQMRLDQGELVIGRSPQADWCIEDPDMFVSRAHCTISSREDRYVITDTSSSGLFVDDASQPLGNGNSAELRNGMRLRLGEYVIWVDLPVRQDAPATRPVAETGLAGGISGDDFFAMKTPEEPKQARPVDLPNPFEQPISDSSALRSGSAAGRPLSSAFDDPFSLDPVPTPSAGDLRQWPASAPEPSGPVVGSDPWTDAFSPVVAPPQPPPANAQRPVAGRGALHIGAPAGSNGDAAFAAFMRGAGVEARNFSASASAAEMEKRGREYRLMMEGIMQLLRKRAEEKGNARVAQTVVGATEVNPLKFMPTVDAAMETILSERTAGFLNGEQAIFDAVKDLAEHHVRAWRGVQAALRRMIDRFDPSALETEMKDSSTMETLLAGGRSAKLWDLYKKRYRETAANAEFRFLGDVGADFRKAYEGE